MPLEYCIVCCDGTSTAHSLEEGAGEGLRFREGGAPGASRRR